MRRRAFTAYGLFAGRARTGLAPVVTALVIGAGSAASAQQAGSPAAPEPDIPGPPFQAQSVKDNLEIGEIENDSVKRGPSGRRVYLFRPPSGVPVQLDVQSKAIDSVVEVFEEGAVEPFAKDDNGGDVVNARLVLRARTDGKPLIVVVKDKDELGGRFELRAAKQDPETALAVTRLIMNGPTIPGALTQESLRRSTAIPYAQYAFEAQRGQRIQVDVMSSAFNTQVELWKSGKLIGRDNDSGEGANSRLVRRLAETGEYSLWVLSPQGALGSFDVAVREVELPGQPGPPIRLTSLPAEVASELTLRSPVRNDQSYATYVVRVGRGRKLVASLEAVDPSGKGLHPIMTLDVGYTGPLGFVSARSRPSSNAVGADGVAKAIPATINLETQSDGDLVFQLRGDMDYIGKYRLIIQNQANSPTASPPTSEIEPAVSP